MARPHSEGLEYFEHDVDASNDEKIESMEAVYGAAGYAFYFKLAERIYRAGGALNVSAAETRQILSRKCLATVEEWEKMLGTALRIGLFDAKEYEANRVLTSNGIQKRCEKVFEKRLRMAEKYKKRVSAAETPAETQAETPPVEESRVEESRVKKKKAKTILKVVDADNLMPAKKDPENIGATLQSVQKANEFAFLRDGTYPYLESSSFSTDWTAWLDMRRRMKVENGPRALVLALNKLHTWPVEKAVLSLQLSVERGYRGIFEPKEVTHGQNGSGWRSGKPTRGEQLDRDATELLREFGGPQAGNPQADRPDVPVGRPGQAGA